MRLCVIGMMFDSKVEHLFPRFIEAFQEIIKGKDPDDMMVIVLHEYAFTKQAIDQSEVKNFINKLIELMKGHEDILLIPGSFATIKKFPTGQSYEQKNIKIKNKYGALSKQGFMAKDQEFLAERDRFDYEIENPYFLQNSAYIITHSDAQKHKKSVPSNEREKIFSLASKENSLFNIGSGQDIRKKIQIKNEVFDLGILICREFYNVKQNDLLLNKPPPLLQVIISDSIQLGPKDELYGALTIHMDSKRKLSLFRNKAHPENEKIEEVKGILYLVTEKMIHQTPVSTVEYSKVVDTGSPFQKKT